MERPAVRRRGPAAATRRAKALGCQGTSLIVGISLAAICLIALANGHGALGIFAANGLTKLVLGAAGALLIVFSLLPRVGRKTRNAYEGTPATGTSRQRPITNGAREGSPVAPVSARNRESRDTTVVAH